MEGSIEYVKLKYISPQKETLINDKIQTVRILVFVSEKPFKQIWPMWKIGNNNMPDIDKECHVQFTLTSKARMRNGEYTKTRGRYGDIYDVSMEMRFLSCQYVSKPFNHERRFETIEEFRKKLKAECERKRKQATTYTKMGSRKGFK